MRLATRYSWQIRLNKYLKKVGRKLGIKKAAPRFEQGLNP